MQKKNTLQDLNNQLFEVKQSFDNFFELYQKILLSNYQQPASISINQNIHNIYNNMSISCQSFHDNMKNANFDLIQKYIISSDFQLNDFKSEESEQKLNELNFQSPFQKQEQSFDVLRSNRNKDKTYKNKKRGKYQKYPQVIKEQAIKLVKVDKKSAKLVSKQLDIPIKNLLRWLELGAIRKKGYIFLFVGGGRKTQDPLMEKKLYEWMKKEESQGRDVTACELKKMAMIFIQTQFRGSFKASKGWLEKFLKRNNITHINKENYGKESEMQSFKNSNFMIQNSHEIFYTDQSKISIDKISIDDQSNISNILDLID